MFQFEYPYFIFLVLLPPLIFMAFSARKDNSIGLPTIYNPNIDWLAKAYGNKSGSSSANPGFKYILMVVWVAIIFALMQPQKIEKISKVTTKGYDIILALDLSRSMLALDFSKGNEIKTRLDVVKEVASKFIMNRKNDRIGIVVFGDDAYVQTPLTYDIITAKSMLQYTEIGLAGNSTALGDAIALSTKTLRDKPKGSRVIILLTDGESTSGTIQPLEAAKLAEDYGIKIYSIGIGKKGKVPFPDERGRILMAEMNIDEVTLKKISEFTGGNYFHADDESGLSKIYAQIDRMEKTESETREIVIRENLFHIPLAIAILLIFLRISVNYKWSKFINLFKEDK